MATPVTFPTPKQIIGFNKEVSQGTAVLTGPAFTFPIDNVLPAPKITALDDTAMRQNMGDLQGRYQGPIHEEISFSGPAYFDTLPLLINNILGDITSTGTLPVSHAMSLLNSGAAQPGSLTMIAWQGMPATTSARYYPGVCLSELTISGNADSTLIMYEAKGLSWPSLVLPTTPATFAPSAVAPLPAWRFAMGLGGTAVGAPVKTIRDFSITIARALRVENTFQNSQNPYIIQRGAVGATGSLTCTVPFDESFFAYYLNNTQPQMQIIGDIGAAATNFGMTIDSQLTAFDSASIKTDEEALGYNGTLKMVTNSANAGASGGGSPIKITMRNQTAAGAY